MGCALKRQGPVEWAPRLRESGPPAFQQRFCVTARQCGGQAPLEHYLFPCSELRALARADSPASGPFRPVESRYTITESALGQGATLGCLLPGAQRKSRLEWVTRNRLFALDR